MQSIYDAAKDDGLKDHIVDKLKEMGLKENDFLDLTRDDINTEFKSEKFVERKKLWKFIEFQQERLTGKNSDGEDSFTMSTRSQAGNRKTGACQEYHHASGANTVYKQGDGNVNVGSGSISAPVHSGNSNTYNSHRGTRVNVGTAHGSNIAGGNISSTTYNAPKEYSKYRINMDRAKGVAIGDHSTVRGNFFN